MNRQFALSNKKSGVRAIYVGLACSCLFVVLTLVSLDKAKGSTNEKALFYTFLALSIFFVLLLLSGFLFGCSGEKKLKEAAGEGIDISTLNYVVSPYEKTLQILLKIALYILCVAVAAMCIIPIYLLFASASHSTSELQSGFTFLFGGNIWNNWQSLKASGFPILRAFVNSLIISLSSTGLCVYFSAMTAYACFAYHFKGRKVFQKLVLILVIIPGQLGMVGFFKLVMDLNMYDTWWPLILPAICSASTVFFLQQYFKANFSMDYVDAARVDGAGELRIFNTIVLPIIKPALSTMALFGIISSWNSYMGPLLFLQSEDLYTLPLLVSELKTSVHNVDLGAMYLGIVLTVLPMIVVYFIMSKTIMKGIAGGGIKE